MARTALLRRSDQLSQGGLAGPVSRLGVRSAKGERRGRVLTLKGRVRREDGCEPGEVP